MKTIRFYLHYMWNEVLFTYLKDFRRGILVLLASILYLALFSTLYNQGSISQIPAVIYDQSQTRASREFIHRVSDADRFHIVQQVSSQEELWDYMDTHHDWVAFQIPPDFASKINAGRHSSILVTMEGNNILLTSLSSLGAMEVIQDFSQNVSISSLEQKSSLNPLKAKTRIKPLDVNYRILGNSTLNYQFFFVFGLALAALQQGLFLSVAASFRFTKQPLYPNEEKRNPFLRLLAKLTPYWLSSMLSLWCVLLVANYGYHIPMMATSYGPFFILIGAFDFLICSVTALICVYLRREETFTRLSVIYTVPAFMLSGFTWPVENMPAFSQTLAKFVPLTYLASPFREYYLLGHSPQLTHNAWILFGAGCIFFILAALAYERKLNAGTNQKAVEVSK